MEHGYIPTINVKVLSATVSKHADKSSAVENGKKHNEQKRIITKST